MGQVAYGSVPQQSSSMQNDWAGFFSLKDDGDEAIVRIMHDSPATFDIVAVHPYQVNGKFRNISCIRDPQEEIDRCPLCAAGVRLTYRFFIHLIQYDRDDRGNIVPRPVVWERAYSFADTIKDYCSEYAPLSDTIFKIKRNGRRGSTDTTYNIMPANPNVYRPELYPKIDFFNGYTVVGKNVYAPDYNGMQRLLAPSEQQVYTPKYSEAAPVLTGSSAPSAYAAPAPQPANPPVYNQSHAEPVSYASTVREPHQAYGYAQPQVPVQAAYSAPAQPQYVPPVSYESPTSYQEPVATQGMAPARHNPVPVESNSGEFVRPRRFV